MKESLEKSENSSNGNDCHEGGFLRGPWTSNLDISAAIQRFPLILAQNESSQSVDVHRAMIQPKQPETRTVAHS